MKKNKALCLETRKIIYDILTKHPGLHLREIERKTNLSYTNVKYHLKYLEKRNLVTSQNLDGYLRFYIKEQMGSKDKIILSFLRKTLPRKILIGLLLHTALSKTEISKIIGKNPATIFFHMKKLEENGIVKVAEIKDGVVNTSYDDVFVEYKIKSSEKIYILLNPWVVQDVIITYKDEMGEPDIIEYIQEIIKYTSQYGYKHMIRPHETVDETVNIIYQVFPHPYYL